MTADVITVIVFEHETFSAWELRCTRHWAQQFDYDRIIISGIEIPNDIEYNAIAHSQHSGYAKRVDYTEAMEAHGLR